MATPQQTDTSADGASWARRIAALFIDWIAASLVSLALLGPSEPGSAEGFVPLGVYVVEATVLCWLLGGSFGQLVVRVRVVPAFGAPRPINPLLLLVRHLLVVLVIPPLVFRPDGRGLHDLAAGTRTVTRRR